ncbi:MAG: hypothetical protein AB7L76_25360, partial [Burkholderiaceae bacterium]
MKAILRRMLHGPLVLACAAGLALHAPGWAASAGSGTANGLYVDLELLPLIGAPVPAALGPLPSVTGSAPPDFNETDTELTANVSIPGAASVGTGVIQVQTQSALQLNSVTSQASVDGLSLSLISLLGLGADSVISTATASCSGSTPSFAGGTTIANGGGTGLLGGVSIDSTPAPNTQLLPGVLGPLGISITLNAQTLAGNTFTVDAIRVSLGNTLLALIGVLDGEIYVSRSVVSMADCLVSQPDLTVAKTGPAAINVGTPFDYTISVSNLGSGASSGTVTVTDTVPANLSISGVSAGPDFSCGVAAQTVTCTRSTPIPGNTSGALAMTIHAVAGSVGPAVNTASVSGGGDSNPGNNTSPPVSTTVVATPFADLVMTLTGPSETMVGTPFDYTLSLANIGTGASSGTVTVTDTIPAGATIQSVTPGPNFVCAPPAGQTVSCNTSTPITSGISGVLAAVIRVMPTAPGPLTNSTASVSGGGDTNPANNTAPPLTTQVAAFSATIIGNPDSGSASGGVPSVVIASVVANDTVDGSPAMLGPGGNAAISPWGAWPTAYYLDPNTGEVRYNGAPQPAGVRVLEYRLCSQSMTPTCGAPVQIQIL